MPPKYLTNPALKLFKPKRNVADLGADMASRPNKHGGRRKGAGRRARVPDSVWRIGRACESVREKLWVKIYGPRYVREWRDRFKTISTRDLAEQAKNVQSDFKALHERISSIPKTIRVPRKEVLSTVAAYFEVSPATVDRYWKRYKKHAT